MFTLAICEDVNYVYIHMYGIEYIQCQKIWLLPSLYQLSIHESYQCGGVQVNGNNDIYTYHRGKTMTFSDTLPMWWVQVILHMGNIGNNWHSLSIGRLVVTASDISWSAMTHRHIPMKRKSYGSCHNFTRFSKSSIRRRNSYIRLLCTMSSYTGI